MSEWRRIPRSGLKPERARAIENIRALRKTPALNIQAVLIHDISFIYSVMSKHLKEDHGIIDTYQQQLDLFAEVSAINQV